jgi:hypothetical protein
MRLDARPNACYGSRPNPPKPRNRPLAATLLSSDFPPRDQAEMAVAVTSSKDSGELADSRAVRSRRSVVEPVHVHGFDSRA